MKDLNVGKVAAAVEADAGHALPGLREALVEATSGLGVVHTPDQVLARRQTGRPVGSKAATHKAPVTLRLGPDALARWRASSKVWQTRAAALLAARAPT